MHQCYVNQDLPPLIFTSFCLLPMPYEYDALGPALPLCIGNPSDAKHSTSSVKDGAGEAALQVAQCCAPWLTSCEERQKVLETMLKAYAWHSARHEAKQACHNTIGVCEQGRTRTTQHSPNAIIACIAPRLQATPPCTSQAQEAYQPTMRHF